MQEFHPLVSVVIPVYNGSNYLREAIDSALGQTYRNCEVIVVNDGSSDGGATHDIVLSYGSRVRYFEKQNGGVSSALNLGIREMKGDYFSWLSHDDVYYSNKIERQIDLLRTLDNRQVVLYGDYDRIDHRSKNIGSTERTFVPPGRMRLELINGSPVNGCSTLIPGICFDRVGLFREDLRTTQDYDMWFRLAGEFPFIHVPYPLFMSRQHPEQGTFTINNHYAERLALLRNCLDQLSPDEIMQLAAMPPALFYMKTALRFRLRGFPETAAYARILAKKNKRDAPIFTQLFISLLDLPYFVLTRKLKPANWFGDHRRMNARVPRNENNSSSPQSILFVDHSTCFGGANRVLSLSSTSWGLSAHRFSSARTIHPSCPSTGEKAFALSPPGCRGS